MTFELHRHDARHVSTLLAAESVDLIVTSPPYFALRSYRDECEACGGQGSGYRPTHSDAKVCSGCGETTNRKRCHNACGVPMKSLPAATGTATGTGCPACNGTGRAHYDGQLGSEATPTEFIDNLIACTADWLRVLKPAGSLWVNLGDKYAGSGGHNNNGLGSSTLKNDGRKNPRPDTERQVALQTATRRNAPDRYNQNADGIRAKSLMGLPWRYALRCIDELGLILRAEVVWSKPNGLPESVTDRVRRSHEQWFHFTREGRYFAAIDEVREEQQSLGERHAGRSGYVNALGVSGGEGVARSFGERDLNPLGKVPGSVWTIPSEPLVVPDHLGVDHFAAFPSELVRRIVLGWSPTGYCCECGEARRAVVEKRYEDSTKTRGIQKYGDGGGDGFTAATGWSALPSMDLATTITGYVCACPTVDAPTRPAVVLDPFAGTGTTPAVAHHLGRHGIGVDLSADYLRLAAWRCTSDRALRDKVLVRTGLPSAPVTDGQLALFSDLSTTSKQGA